MSIFGTPCFCSCCESISPRTPATVGNRPGLSALAFRVGTFASFRETMLEEIARQTGLTALATRESDDYSITLIELFAAVADVLSFYNERISNELFLPTARERDSMLRLVRLIGYRLRPGLAATAMLSFLLDAGAQTRIAKGLKVMSIPGQDERPQTFETIEEILADARLNEPPVHAPPVAANPYRRGCRAASLSAGPDSLIAGDRLVFFGGSVIEEKVAEKLETRRDGRRLSFAPGISADGLSPLIARVAKSPRRLRFFGHNASATYPRYDANPATPVQDRWRTLTAAVNFSSALTTYPLDARYDDLKPGTPLLVDAGPAESPRLRTAVVSETDDGPVQLLATDPGATVLLEDTVTRVGLRRTIRGRPSVVASPESVVVRAGDAHVMFVYPSIDMWSPLQLISSRDPAVIRTSASNLEFFACDADGGLQQATLLGALLIFTGWQDRSDGLTLTTAPVPLELDDGTLLVFARGPDQALWMRQILPVVTAWGSLGGEITSAPRVVARSGARVDVFARGADRAPWRRARVGGVWQNWEALEGVLATAPAVASSGSTRLDVVALGDDGKLIHRRRIGGAWDDWRSLSGDAREEPALIAGAAHRLDVFVRGDDDALWTIARVGGVWQSWESLGGSIAGPPTVVRMGADLRVYAQGGDGTLMWIQQTGSVWGDWSPLGAGFGDIPDRRATRIYELASPEVEFREYDYPSVIDGGQVAIRLADATELQPLDKNRRILLDDGVTRHLAQVTASELIASTPGEPADHLLIDFDPVPPVRLHDSVLHGNISKASHGETQPDDPLGHGDASRAFMKYRLRRSPLTYLPSGSSAAGTAELEIRINGELWQEVASLYGRGPTERVFTARQSDDGGTEVAFGDGLSGARTPTGSMNIIAHYRTGLGLAGRMKADQLAIPLVRPVGLRAVTNPLPADGGADPESRDDARSSAPNSVRTFGRAVSLQDFEWVATASGLIARACATWVWRGLEKAVHLTVAAAGGGTLSADSLYTLFTTLNASRDPNHPLLLANLVRVPVVISAHVLCDPAYEPAAVIAAATTALSAHFAFQTMPLGCSVHASDLYAVLQSVAGVTAANLNVFQLKDYEDLTTTELSVRATTSDSVQEHVRIFPARPTPVNVTQIDRYARSGFTGTPPPVLAAEQAYIEDPAADLTLIAVEAL